MSITHTPLAGERLQPLGHLSGLLDQRLSGTLAISRPYWLQNWLQRLRQSSNPTRTDLMRERFYHSFRQRRHDVTIAITGDRYRRVPYPIADNLDGNALHQGLRNMRMS